MSTDYRSVFVIGVLVQEKTESSYVDRYHEITGKKYQKEVIETYHEIKGSNIRVNMELVENAFEYDVHGLGGYVRDVREDGLVLIGYKVAATDYYKNLCVEIPKDLSKYLMDWKQLCAISGIPYIEPNLYTFLEIS